MSLFFMAGIVFQILNGGLSHGFLVLAVIAVVFLIFRLLHKVIRPVLLGLAAYTFCFIAGAEICKSDTEILDKEHFSKIENIDSYIAVIDDEVTHKNKTYSSKVKVLYVYQDSAWKKATGNILAYFPLTDKTWKYGDRLLINGQPDEVPVPLNLKAFDYKKYLSYKNISHQHFIKKGEVAFLISDPPSTVWMFAFKARETMSGMLRSALGPGQEFAVASMIILGIKQRVDQDLIDAYSSSGAMHVLAVSGLHVGMIFGLIQLLLGWLTKFKRWKHLFYFIALLLIWSFGLITAFSPSVLRAVVMFTVIIIGQWIQKKGNLYNTLGITAFAILLFDPYMLMNVGFQMSFLAVFGIAYLHPQLSAWYKGKNFITKWLWEVTSISLCAQLFTFPLGLFYFNQFPTYFLISNLWIIPLSSAILYIGIVFFAGAFWIQWKSFMGFILKYSVMALNKSMYIVSFIPGSVQRTIYFDSLEIVFLYLLIISMLLLFYFRNRQWMYASISFALLFSGLRVYKIHRLSDIHQVTVGQVKGQPYLIVQCSGKASVWLPAGTDSSSYFVKSQILSPLRISGVEDIRLNYLSDKASSWYYKWIKIQLCYLPKVPVLEKNVNFVCIPYNSADLGNYNRNTQIKKVILYNNKSIGISADPLWDINANGVFTVDI